MVLNWKPLTWEKYSQTAVMAILVSSCKYERSQQVSNSSFRFRSMCCIIRAQVFLSMSRQILRLFPG